MSPTPIFRKRKQAMLHVLFLLHKLLADLEVHSGYVTWRDKTIAFIVLVSEKL